MPADTPALGGVGHIIRRNGFGDRAPEMPGEDNTSDHNLFVNPPGVKPFELAAWQKQTGREVHSITWGSTMALSHREGTLCHEPLLPTLEFPRVPAVTFDFFVNPRPAGSAAEAGPFVLQSRKPTIVLREGGLDHGDRR